MKLGTANIKNFPDMAPGKVAQDAHTVTRHTSVCGLQEIQVGEDTDVVRDNLPASWELLGGHTTCPVLVNGKLWRVVTTRALRSPRPRLPHPENPHMDVVAVVLQSRKRPRLPKFAVVNTHLAAGGYNGPQLPAVQEQWDVEWKVYRAVCHSMHDMGLTVYAVGDFNHPHPPPLGPRARWLTPGGPADHVGELPNPLSVHVPSTSTERVQLNSDHDLLVVSGGLRIH